MPERGRGTVAGLAVLLGLWAASGCRSPVPQSEGLAPTAIDALVASGADAYWSAEYDSAGARFAAALNLARSEGALEAEATALTWLGSVAWRRHDYPTARDLLGQALDFQARHGITVELWRTRNLLGLIAWNEDRYYEALDQHGLAAEQAEAVADTVSLAKSWNNVALALTELGDFDRARTLLLQALPIARASGQALVEGRVLVNLGMLAVRTGEPDQAIQWLMEAEGPVTAAEDVEGQLNRLGQLGTAWAARGEPGRAIAWLDSALVQARQRDQLEEVASNLGQMAEVYAEAGDYARALRLLSESRALSNELGARGEAATALLRTAEIHLELGNPDLARRSAREALAIHEAGGDRLDRMHGLLVLARAAQELGDSVASRTWLLEAGDLARELGAPAPRLRVALVTARLADQRGNRRQLDRALESAKPDLPAGGLDAEWEYFWLAARAATLRADRNGAHTAAARAVEAVERVRGEFSSAILRTRYQDARTAVYQELVDALLRLGRVEEALEAADASRGRVLLDHLAAIRTDGAATPRELAEEERQHLRRIDDLTTTIARVRTAGRRADERAYQTELSRLEADLERVRAEYALALTRADERQSSALVGGRGPGPRPDAARIRAALRPGEALLEFYPSSDQLHRFLVTPAGVHHSAEPLDRAGLVSRIRVVRELVGRPEGTQSAEGALEALYRTLFGPLAETGALAGIGTLILVPHGELEYLPFAALRNPAAGRWLVEDYALLHLPSAAALPALRGRGGTAEEAATVLAPFPRELPWSAEEARTVTAGLSGSRRLLGPEATEAAMREALAGAGLVHLAAHGVLNARNPLFSRMELVPGGRPGEADDGRLEVHEIHRMRIGAWLVFLSGCETGLGGTGASRFGAGEDYATLVRAFLSAGAANVVATLWRIEDRGAAEFAERFYRELRTAREAGADPAGALAQVLARAQRDLLRDPARAAPYHWAGYRLTGTGGIRPGARLARDVRS